MNVLFCASYKLHYWHLTSLVAFLRCIMNTNCLSTLSDTAVLEALGSRLAAVRLKRNLTQTALGREAGVSRATIERLERGAGADLKLVVRVLRALQLLEGFLAGIPADEPSPMALLRAQGKKRQRARGESPTAAA
jgi:DNA-binding XRE family transcriptional regulator